MKSRFIFSVLVAALLTALTIPFVGCGGASALDPPDPKTYTVIDLGTLGGTYSQSFSVNSTGVVSGQASLSGGTWHAILWQGAHISDLGTLGGQDSSAFGAPNALGQVAGMAETSSADPNGEDFCGFAAQGVPSSGTCLGFLWQNGSMSPLSTLGGNNSAASMINKSSVIAGYAETAAPDSTCPSYEPAYGQYQVLEEEPVVWKKGQIQELPTYGGDPDGFALAINDSGQVAGASGACSTLNVINGTYVAPVHALFWQSNGTVTNIPSLGGASGNQAHNINNSGQVVGASDLSGDEVFHGFVWSPGATTSQDIPPLSGDTYSVALAINDAGEVGGVSIDSTFTTLRAFVVVNGVPTDLNTLIPANSPLQLLTACGINSRGEITGMAMEKSTGEYRGYLAIPPAGANPGN